MTYKKQIILACSCEDWKEYIPTIESSFTLQWAHGLNIKWKQFEYCPWCGKKLEEINNAPLLVDLQV